MSSDIIGTKRAWVEILEDLSQAVIWDWIYFMRHSGADPLWVAKSDTELSQELWVTPYQIQKTRERLINLGWIKTKLRRWAGAPTMHYQVQEEVVDKVLRVYQLWSSGDDWGSLILRKHEIHLSKSHNGFDDIAKSLTALTSSLDINMIKNRGQESLFLDGTAKSDQEDLVKYGSGDNVFVDLRSGTGEIYETYEQEIGALTPFIAQSLSLLMDDYSHPWIVEALRLCAKYNKRSLKYAEAILKNWERDGRGANIDGESGEPEKMSQTDFNKLSSYSGGE